MQKQLPQAHSQESNALTILSTDVILREQPDKREVIKIIAKEFGRIAMLWQIPNWNAENSVVLAEWTYDNYKFETIETILGCLKNPPVTEEKIYRLTPDIVTVWMTAALEKEATKREREHNKTKDSFKEVLPEVNYESFKKRLEQGNALKDHKPEHWKDDQKYQEWKTKRYQDQVSQSQNGVSKSSS